MSEEAKKRIIGLEGIEAYFGGKVPSAEQLAEIEIVEDGKVARSITDITKAVVFKRDNLFLLFSEETANEFQQWLEKGKGVAFRYDLAKAFEIREKIKAEVNAEQDRYRAIHGLITHDFGNPKSVWVSMKTLVTWAVENFSPVVGKLEEAATRLKFCAENAAQFAPAYVEELAIAAPKDRKSFMEWDENFRKEYRNKGGRVPFIMGLKLITRRFGRYGTFGCFLLEGDVELFKELHGKKRDRDGKLILDKDGKPVPVSMFHSDAYLGVCRWKHFFLADEERQIEERRAEDEAKELEMCTGLGGFVTDEVARSFRRNGHGESRGLKKLGRRDYERRNRNERRLDRD